MESNISNSSILESNISTLRWLTCGHVDDGKSTLMGCLWHAMGIVPEDTKQKAIRADGTIDYANLLDGLEDELAQGITIDVAWRFALYNNQHWILADTPGHQQYTHNMAVAASYSDGALIVLDANHGVREQTRKHAKILDFFAITKKVIVINKMDSVKYNEEQFNQIKFDVLKLFSNQEQQDIVVIPAAALYGEMVEERGDNLNWYLGPTVLEALQKLNLKEDKKRKLGSLSTGAVYVQSSMRYQGGRSEAGRSYLGSVVGSEIKVGDTLFVAGRKELSAKIAKLWVAGEVAQNAVASNSISIQLDAELDIARGSVLEIKSGDFFASTAVFAKILWLVPEKEKTETWQGNIKLGHQLTGIYAVIKNDTVNADSVSGFATIEIESATSLIFKKSTIPGRENLFLLINSETSATEAIGVVTEDMQEKDWSI